MQLHLTKLLSLIQIEKQNSSHVMHVAAPLHISLVPHAARLIYFTLQKNVVSLLPPSFIVLLVVGHVWLSISLFVSFRNVI